MPVGASAAAAHDERIAELERRLDESLVLIDKLSARVRQLEADDSGVAPAAVDPAPQTTERLAVVEQQLSQLSAASADRQAVDTGLPIHGFADVGAGTHNAIFPDLEGFNVGQLELYLNPRLGERTLALFEMIFEINDQGETGADLERAQIGYQFNDSATVWLGRFHTPFGYYNTAFHHGQQIATSLRRPRFLQFEDTGGFMPVHTVGVWVTGARRLAAGKLTYDLFTGNAQHIVGGSLNPHTAGTNDGDFIFGGNVGYEFSDALDGLKIGLSAFSSEIDDDQLPLNSTQVNSIGAYLAYDTDSWENIAEFYSFDNEDQSGDTGSHGSNVGFIQFGYRLRSATPYARYERAELDQTDNYFAQQLSGMSYYRYAGGVRFDLDEKSAFKLELADTHVTDRMVQQWNEALLQYSIRF
ncbi:MAG: hypothetical protein ACREVZ_13825 [Burkholderiales bacterium]